MNVPADLLDRALALDEPARAELAHRLIQSLGPRDPGWEEAWAAEIRERERRLDSGESVPIPAEEVLDELRQALRRGRNP